MTGTVGRVPVDIEGNEKGNDNIPDRILPHNGRWCVKNRLAEPAIKILGRYGS